MKKYLLSLLVVGLSFIGFSNAGSYNFNFTYPSEDYLAVSIDSVSNGAVNVNVSSLTNCDGDFPFITFCGGYNSSTCISEEVEIRSAGSYNIDLPSTSVPYNYLLIGGFCSANGTLSSSLIEGGETGGESGGDSDNELIGQLSPVIEGLENTITEFIPFVVYIGLGILSVIIGFVAIKRLINRTKGKSLGVFSSRRKRK